MVKVNFNGIEREATAEEQAEYDARQVEWAKGAVAREKQLSQSNPDEETVSLTDEAGKMMKETGKDKLNIMDLAKIHGLLD